MFHNIYNSTISIFFHSGACNMFALEVALTIRSNTNFSFQFIVSYSVYGTVWRMWQVISCLGLHLSNYQFSQHCIYIL